METTALTAAYGDLLAAARTVAGRTEGADAPPGEWDADQILGHVALVTSATLATACAVVSGAVTTYDNRLAQDPWTIDRVVARSGGTEGLCRRLEHSAQALAAFLSGMGGAELDTPVPTLLLSNGVLQVEDHLPLRLLVDGLVTTELPGHAGQLRRLVGGAG